MHARVFANLPVTGLERRKRFFVARGDRPNPQCSGGSAACIVLGEQIVAMLLVKECIQTFTPKPITDSTTTTEVLTALSCTSADEDLGFMFQGAFEDPDGRICELVSMKPAHLEQST